MPRPPMPSGKDEIVRLIQETLGPKVEFALLFGSVLKPSFWDESDVDIAAYFKGDVGPGDLHDYRQLELEILKSILRERLGDLEEFSRAIYRFVEFDD